MSDIVKIKKIIEESGNNLHYKVVDFLRANGWYVLVSPYYTDNFSEKPREIDIIAEKNFSTASFGQFTGTVNIQLFIECKYIKEDTVFWFDKRNQQEAINLVLRTTPFEDPHRYSMTGNHHYLTGSLVAKLFASKVQSPDGEVFYKAITQSLNGMIAYNRSGSILPDVFNSIRNDKIKTTLKYPVIVCNSFENLYKHDVTQKVEPENITENFEIETQYAYFDHSKNQRNEFFLIDVASLDTLENHLQMLETKDLKAIKEKLSWNDREEESSRGWN